MGEYTKYPDQIDTTTELPKVTDLVTPVKAEVANRLRDAILAIENESGVQPSGTYSTIRARLDAMDIALLSLGIDVGSIDPTIDILHDAVSINPDANAINFTGNVEVTNDGSGVIVEIVGGQATQVQEAFTPTNGQTEFTLSQTPFQNGGVQMYVNGVKMRYGSDYTVDGTAVTYTDDVSIVITDDVEFWYLVDSSGLGAGVSGVIVQDEGLEIDSEVTTLNFTGNVIVTNPSPGITDIAISGLDNPQESTDQVWEDLGAFTVTTVDNINFGVGSRIIQYYGDNSLTTVRGRMYMPADVATAAVTKVELVTIAIATGRTSTFRGSVAGWPAAGAGQHVDILFHAENIGGTVSIIGAVVSVSGASLGTVTVEFSTSNAVVYVEPVDTTAYTWRCNLTEER